MILFPKKPKEPKKDKKESITVILPAAGSGTRLGGISKPLMTLCGKCVIEYSLEIFEGIDDVTRIVISTREEDIPKYEEIVKKRGFKKVIGIISGGSTRQESVTKAFEFAFSDILTDFVAIHDAARPLITEESVRGVFEEAKKYGCAVCAAPCPDTVKRTEKSGFVSESVSREGLYLIQTPQVFSYSIYCTSLALAQKDGYEATDDSSLAEYAGFKIKLYDTPRDNMKITYPSDIPVAQAILGCRKDNV